MSNFKVRFEEFERGPKTRRAVLGSAYVDESIEQAQRLAPQIQNVLSGLPKML